MKLWDPHFHIWDVSAGVDDAGYSLASYERDVASDGFEPDPRGPARLFGAFAHLVGAMPEADRQRLFAENARRAYGVSVR